MSALNRKNNLTCTNRKCVTVLGANGFLGMHLVAELVMAGYAVRAFDRTTKQNPLLPVKMPVSYITGDFFNKGDLTTALLGSECCFHLISTSLPKTSNDDPYTDVQSNVCGTLRMLDIAHDVGVKKIIFASSGGTVYGTPQYVPIDEAHPSEPLCSYGITKLAIEKYLALYQQLKGLDFVSLRIANPYGPLQNIDARQGVIGVFLGNLLRKEALHIWGDGSVIRDYLYVTDVARAFVLAMEKQVEQSVINIGSGIGTTLNEMVEYLGKITCQNPSANYEPKRGFDVSQSVLDITRAKKELGWKPTVSFEEGLKNTWKWLLENQKNCL